MQPGIIYVLINPCMPGFVKIGMTTRTSEARAREISSSTGVPSPFIVAYEEDFSDCVEAERIIHARLERHRVNRDREFFCLAVKDAIQVVASFAQELKSGSTAGASKHVVDPASDSGRVDLHPTPWWKAKQEILSTHSTQVCCAYCGRSFSVTLRRGENQAVCPACGSLTIISNEW